MSTGQYCNFDDRFNISKANGIEFRISPDNTFGLRPETPYNEQDHCGKFFKEYCQPLPCDGAIRLQHTWCDNDDKPILGIFTPEGVLIEQVPGVGVFGETTTTCTDTEIVTNGTFETDLTGWSSVNSPIYPQFNCVNNWQWTNLNAGASLVVVDSAATYRTLVFSQSQPIVSGLVYTINISAELQASLVNANLYFVFFNSGFSTQQRALIATVEPGINSITFTITADANYTDFGFQFESTVAPATRPFIYINDISIIERDCDTNTTFDRYEYEINLNNEDAICEQCIQLKIYRESFFSESLTLQENNAPGPFSSIGYLNIAYYLTTIGSRYRLSITQDAMDTFPIGKELRIEGANTLILSGNDGRLVLQYDFIAQTAFLNIFSNMDDALNDQIGWISMSLVEIDIASFEAVSEPICVSDEVECLTKIEYWDSSILDNVDFSDGFKHVMYVPLIEGESSYPEEKTVYRTSKGVTKKISGRLSQITPFKSDYLPEYMRRKLALAMLHDNVLIDGEQWTSDEDISIEPQDRYTLAQVMLNLTKKIFNYDNTNCS